MSRRRGSATALNASEVVAALATLSIYSHIGICQALFLPIFPPRFCRLRKKNDGRSKIVGRLKRVFPEA